MNEDDYPCDKCEDPIKPNDNYYEVRYGFICEKCYERVDLER